MLFVHLTPAPRIKEADSPVHHIKRIKIQLMVWKEHPPAAVVDNRGGTLHLPQHLQLKGGGDEFVGVVVMQMFCTM